MTVLEVGLAMVMLFLAMTLVRQNIRLVNCLQQEKTQRKQSEQRLAMQYFLGEGLAQADSIPTGINFALQVISQHLGWPFAAYWEADATLERLHCVETWTEREAGLEQFESVVRSTVYTRGVGLPGKVFGAGELAAIEDVRINADFPHPSPAAEAALQGALAFPLVVANRCVGVMEFMTFAPIDLTAGHRQMFSALGAQIAAFIERKRAEGELRTSEERFRFFITHTPVPAFVQDGEGKYRHVNEPLCQLFSRPPERWDEKTVFDLWPPETAKKLHAHDRIVLNGNEVVQSEEQLSFSEGETHHWVMFKFPFRNHSGQKMLAGIGIDITQRKRDEEQRDQFFNTSHDLICLVGIDGYYKRINPAFERSLGFSPDELLARPCMEFVHLEDREATTTALEHVRADQGAVEFLSRHRCRNGSYRWIQWRATSMTGSLVSAVGRDVTERKILETSIKETQQRCEYLANAINGIAWEVNPVTMRFTYVSPQAEPILGYPIERWLTDPAFWKNHLHPADRDRACLARTLIKTDRRTCKLEYRMISADGKTVWFHDLPTMVAKDGQPTRILGIMTDVTDQKRMDQGIHAVRTPFSRPQPESNLFQLDLETVQESLASQARLLTLGQLTGSVAHELRHPLRSIRIALNVLRHRLPSTDPESAQYIDMAEEETIGATRAIRNLLSMARAEEFRMEEVDLSRLLADVQRRVCLPEEIRFHWTLNPDPFFLKADPTHLSQVFTNLIQFSAQAMDGSGEILLTASTTQNLAIITLYDTGPGLSYQDREYLFEPLFTTKAQGLGFSLSITRHIIERHGGEIEYISDQGCGAAFCLRLPYGNVQEATNSGHYNEELALQSLSHGGSPWKQEI